MMYAAAFSAYQILDDDFLLGVSKTSQNVGMECCVSLRCQCLGPVFKNVMLWLNLAFLPKVRVLQNINKNSNPSTLAY